MDPVLVGQNPNGSLVNLHKFNPITKRLETFESTVHPRRVTGYAQGTSLDDYKIAGSAEKPGCALDTPMYDK